MVQPGLYGAHRCFYDQRNLFERHLLEKLQLDNDTLLRLQKVECDAHFYGHLEETLKNYKEYQLDQAQQGLKPFRRIPQTEDFAKMLERRTGESVDLGKYAGDDPTLALIQQLGRAMKADDVDPEQAARIQDIIKDLSKKRVSKPDGPAPKPNTVGIANQRRAQKARQQKSGKGKGKGKGKAAETSEAPAGEAEGTTEE